ncbi:MAG: hypothetical protein L0271_07430 [Gemmatimonadetes bacterium]|nr:hypothetical protein [Gemmatimonadota bacterium]
MRSRPRRIRPGHTVRARAVRSGASLVCVLTTFAVLASPADAQIARDTTRPFVQGGVYDRPYLGRLLGRTAIGGYAEAHARWERADGVTEEAGFVPKRFNLFTATQVSDFVRVGAELEFEEGTEEIKLEYAAIDVLIHPSLGLRGGMILSPLGRFNLSHDSPLNEFTDRPLVSTELLGVALSEPGLGLFGTVPLGGMARLTYEAYAVNGFHDGLITDAPDGTRVPLGRANIEDGNASPAFVARLAWSPSLALELGVSAHHGAWNRFEVDGAAIDDRRDLTLAVFDFDADLAGFQLTGEAATASIDLPPSLERINASAQRGAFVDIVRDFGHGWVTTMPASFFAAKLRLESLDFDTDLDGDDVRRLALGVNFRPTRDTALKLDYVRSRTRDRFSNPSEHAALLFSIATYF